MEEKLSWKPNSINAVQSADPAELKTQPPTKQTIQCQDDKGTQTSVLMNRNAEETPRIHPILTTSLVSSH